jgi:hypothetical protein
MSDKSSRAWDLFCELQPPEPYVHELPAPDDEVAGALREIFGRLRNNPNEVQGGSVTLTTTHSELPSVHLAFDCFARAHGIEARLEVRCENDRPELRAPKDHVDFTLFAWDDRAPRPNVAPPDPRAQQAIAEIARGRYNLELWAPAAEKLAQQLGVQWVPQLVSTMAYPPELPTPETDPIGWIQRVQIAAALAIAYVETEWNDSTRKRTLYSLALGPNDTSVDAAVIAMGWIARTNAEARRDIEPFFAWLEQATVTGAPPSYERALLHAWHGLGSLDPDTAQRLDEKLQSIRSRVSERPPGPNPSGNGAHASL